MKLYNGDCIEIMGRLENRSIDMILTDLPYGTTKNGWDRLIPIDKLWAQFERIIKDRGAIVLFAQTPFDKLLGASRIELLKYEWVWLKCHATGHLNAKKMPMKKHENILVFCKKTPVYHPQMAKGTPYIALNRSHSSNYGPQRTVMTRNDGQRYPTSVLAFKSDRGLHPTQKPVALCEYLIRTYTDEGDTVLDCCMGSGTTGVACRNANRNFIGIERDEAFFLAASKRLREGEVNN